MMRGGGRPGALWMCFLAALCACVTGERGGDVDAAASAAALEEATAMYWEHAVDSSIYLRTTMGLPIEALPDVSPASSERDAEVGAEVLARLAAVDPEDLNHDQFISLEILRWLARDLKESAGFYWLNFDVTPFSSPLTSVAQAFAALPLGDPDDLARYLRLLGDVPDLVRGIEHKLVEQVRQDIVLPRAELDQVVPFLRSLVGEGDASPFNVASERLGAIDAAEADAFVAEVAALVDRQVNPALRSLAEFTDGDYRSAAPDTVGLGQYPGGEEYYRYLVRHYTTVDVTPEEVHQIGLDQVAQIDAALSQVRDSVGFEGTKAEFHEFLKTDPRFFPKSPEEIADRHLAYAAEMDAVVNDLFLRRPQAPYGVKRLDPEYEASMTFGYYQMPTPTDPVGYYRFNGSNLDERSLVYNQPLTLHELIPGHHFQLNLQAENQTLSDFRRHSHFAAYSEGWGEYGTFLALEAGLVDDPYDLYGLHIFDMYGSVRLVVDTGVNYFNWSRERVMDMMREHLTDSETQIRSEALRYSVGSPGQALCYKIGMLRWVALREHAEEQLGDDFDIRRFHDATLSYGAMPMSVLAQHVDWFIEQERATAGQS